MPRHLQIVSTTPNPAEPVEAAEPADEPATWGDLLTDLIYTARTAGLDPLLLRMAALAKEHAQTPLPNRP